MHKIQSLEKPEMNDELAQLIGPDFNTLEDLRNSIRAEMIEAKKAEADESYMEKTLDALVEQSTMVYRQSWSKTRSTPWSTSSTGNCASTALTA